MVWCSMIRYGTVRYGMVWYGMVWYDCYKAIVCLTVGELHIDKCMNPTRKEMRAVVMHTMTVLQEGRQQTLAA